MSKIIAISVCPPNISIGFIIDRYSNMTDLKKSNQTHSTPSKLTPQAKSEQHIAFFHEPAGETMWNTIEKYKGNPIPLSKLYKTPAEKEVLYFGISQYHLRQKAKEKWSYADTMWFTEQGMQQATSETISKYKAGKVTNKDIVLIGCSGIGGEAIELAKVSSHVTAVEMDSEVMAVGKANIVNQNVTFICDDLITFLGHTKEQWDVAFVDPDRRTNNRRQVDVESYSPAFSKLLPLLKEKTKRFYIKVAPAIRYESLWNEGYGIECIQEGNVMKEVVVFFGEPQTRKATVLENGHAYSYEKMASLSVEVQKPARGEGILFLHEPIACILRAELVGNIAEETRCFGVHPKSAILWSTSLIPSGLEIFFTSFRIETILAFHPKNIRKFLKEKGIEKCVIKKRFFPMEPDSIRKTLKIKEGGETILYFTTFEREERVCIVCTRL